MEVPQPYKTAGLMNLVAGGLNILTAGVWILSFIWVCIGIFWLVPAAMGAWQVMVGLGMNNGEPKDNAKTAAIVGAIAGLFNFNPLTIILSVVAIMQLGNDEVVGWLESNG